MSIQTRLDRIESALRPPEEPNYVCVLRVDPCQATNEQEGAYQRQLEAAHAIGKEVMTICLKGLTHEEVRHPRSGKRAADVCQQITKQPTR